jgi:cbb3-type cytochrome oxidase subunit 3
MLKDINYWWVSLFLVAMVALIVWMFRRDRKDEKAFEKELLEQEVREDDKDHDEKSPDNL